LHDKSQVARNNPKKHVGEEEKMSLTEKEKVYEKSLDNLHYLSIGELDLENTDEVLENLEVTIKEWVFLFVIKYL
jgi:hypothetical protein